MKRKNENDSCTKCGQSGTKVSDGEMHCLLCGRPTVYNSTVKE